MRFLSALFCCMLLAACASTPSRPGQVSVSGALTMRERLALPEQAEATITLLASGSGVVLAEQHIPLAGRQVPVAFTLSLDDRQAGKAGSLILRGRIAIPDGPAWESAPQTLTVSGTSIDAGTLLLQRVAAARFSSTLDCGEFSAPAEFDDDGARLEIAGKLLTLQQVVAASGVKYQAVEEAGTILWLKGNTGRLERHGKTYPDCTLRTDGRLSGGEWLVTALNGAMPLADSRITLIFDDAGRVGGRASCNGYFAGYETAGDTLRITRPGATLMACNEALMQQEQLFLELLTATQRYRFQPDGSLLLETNDGRSLTARRQ